jgi:ABC-2 type transport system ATP-binding protein
MPAATLLAARSLSKTYGSVAALVDLTLEARQGECLGLLGPNGAGKTTALSIVCSLIRPDHGTVEIAGTDVARDPRAAWRRLGLVAQELSLYEELTARENLRFFGSLYGLWGKRLAERVAESLALAGLEDRADDRADTFSAGMKRRLNLAIGVVHDPEILLLDEPTVGVDPESRNHLFEMVLSLKQRGKTIVYTTRDMEEAERLCDRIAIVDRGRLLALGTREELLQKIGGTGPATLETVFLTLTGRALRD